MKYIQKFSNNSQSIFYNILACFFASIMIALVRELSYVYHIFFIVMVRNFFALLFYLPYVLKDVKSLTTTSKLKLHIARGANGMFAMFAWFYAVANLPLSESVSISFVAPIITTLFAIFIFKEKVKGNVWMSFIIGLIGMIIILRPGFKELNLAHFFAIISVLMWAVTNILVKQLSKTENHHTVVFYMSFTMLIMSIPFAVPYYQDLGLREVILFICLGLVSNLTHIYISLSYSKADLSVVQPFDFTRLIFTSLIAYFIFEEVIDLWVVIGSIVILSGVVVAAPKRKKKTVIDPIID